jgi:hypothetical protein
LVSLKSQILFSLWETLSSCLSQPTPTPINWEKLSISLFVLCQELLPFIA